MAEFTTIEYQVPAHWLCAIVNDDWSDLEDDPRDLRAARAFCKHEVQDAIVEVTSEEGYFSRSHDGEAYGLTVACEVHDCLFHFPVHVQLDLPVTP